MGLRKGHCYTKVERAYTRKSKVKSKSYIKTIPPKKISRYFTGNIEAFNKGLFTHKVAIITKNALQLRDNAIEAARQIIVRHLEANLKKDFYLEVNAHPHHILRENKMLTGAGADRMSTGMQLSFGTPIGTAAQLPAGGKIFSIYCFEKDIPLIRKIITKAKSKLPMQKGIVVEKIK